jgi:tRNA pseudouridine13 synthase
MSNFDIGVQNCPDEMRMCVSQAHIKREPGDWRVSEQLDIDFSGEGEHAYFFVEKENLNTADVAAALARAVRVEPFQVGFAGLKDKHAVTRQWFSVPCLDERWPLDSAAAGDMGARCLAVQRHHKKLRRGQHTLNHFEIRLRDVVLPDAVSLTHLGGHFANFFGPQRTSVSNVSQALAWLANRRKRKDRRRGWHLSVLRSMLFNEVLKQRVALGNFADQVEGDVNQEGVATGPLWGRGRSPVTGEAAVIEQTALRVHKDTCEALEFAGVDQARRKLVETPQAFVQQRLGGNDLMLSFALPPGAYATALLAATFDIVDDSRRSGDA